MCGLCRAVDLKFQSCPACVVLTDCVLQRQTKLVLRAHCHTIHGEDPITDPEPTGGSHWVEDLAHLQPVDCQADLATLEQVWHDKGLSARVWPAPAQRFRKRGLLSRAVLDHSASRDAVDAVWREVIAVRHGDL
eukprot:CAMPEP_0115587032 /NCGR_PEP_ID=MMETSP0272-20121206/7999_1 /TAXON_ID=71861 /ORGANISM="Scrippsiella trochoidea, Strain CCMP3099" /LENGTH=133 /DNA_ID=CAMNT_0003022103 /DNA_START=707 /DNA_END=1108 /DNA_ORIENTATION=-